MKQNLTVLFFLLLTLIGVSQSTSKDTGYYYPAEHFYYPNGVKYNGTAKTISELNAELEKEGRVYFHLLEYKEEYTIVGFKLFTDIPLWVETKTPEVIDSAIRSFRISDYYKYFINIDLNKYVKQKNLNSNYFFETLGKPISIKDSTYNEKPARYLTYNDLGLITVFSEDLLVAYKQELDTDYTDERSLHATELSLQLKENNFYWLTESYEKFQKDTSSEDFFAAQWSSTFKVLHIKGNYVFIQFDQLSSVSNDLKKEPYISKRFNEDTIYTKEVNTEDFYYVKNSDFSLIYYSKIGEKIESDYLLKGLLHNKNNEPIKNKKMILVIDENYSTKDSVLLKTDSKGTFYYRGNTLLNFLCTTGIKNRMAYYKRHKDIIFTLIIDDKKYIKNIKQKALSDSNPIIFDILLN